MRSENLKEIKIGFSCHKEWPKMKGDNVTRHCESCNKTVFNFSNSTNQEVIEFLTKQRGNKTCGKFNQSQIESINGTLQLLGNSKSVKPFILATTVSTMIACSTSKQSCDADIHLSKSKVEIIAEVNHPDTANTIIIKGQILDDANQPLIGANLMLGYTNIGCTTDLDGKFNLQVSKNELN